MSKIYILQKFRPENSEIEMLETASFYFVDKEAAENIAIKLTDELRKVKDIKSYNKNNYYAVKELETSMEIAFPISVKTFPFRLILQKFKPMDPTPEYIETYPYFFINPRAAETVKEDLNKIEKIKKNDSWYDYYNITKLVFYDKDK